MAGTRRRRPGAREGERALEPGLLAEANRGILYVDEINLLDDHLTDVLLDAAALGVNVVEREGVSVSHPARFLLVGTMNEEEGELRPQIADRIGLEVEVEALADPAVAGTRWCGAARRSPADPDGFRQDWAAAQAELAGALAAGERAPRRSVRVPDPLYGAVGRLVVGSGVSSHRADITIVECAKAIAALAGRAEVEADDVLEAAELALGHRLEVDPFGPPARAEPHILRRLLDDALEIEVSRKKVEGDGRASARGRRRRRTAHRQSTSVPVDPSRVLRRIAAGPTGSSGRGRPARALVRRPPAGQVRAPPAGATGRHGRGARCRRCGRRRCAAVVSPSRSGRRISAARSASIARPSPSASWSTTAGRCTPSAWSRR